MTELTVSQPTTASSEFSVGTHFNQTWSIFKATALRMFLVQLVVGVLSLLVMVGVLGFIFYVTMANQEVTGIINNIVAQKNPGLILTLPGWYWQTVGYSVLLLIAVWSFILTPFSSAGLIMAVADGEKKQTFGQILAKSIRLIPQLAVLTSVLFVINMGATWLFLLPGMITGILLSFSVYELVLENKGVVSALRSSLALVKSDFWLVLGRAVFLLIIYLIVFNVMPNLLGSIHSSLAALYNVLAFIPSFLSGLFGVAYSMALYKHLKQKQTKKSEASLAWIWLLALAGWLIFVGLAMGAVRLINSPTVRQAVSQEWTNLLNEATLSGQLKTDTDWQYDVNTNQEVEYDYKPAQQPSFVPKQPTAYPTVKSFDTQKQVQTSSCTNYNIREGEFASNKCYTDEDYDDLFYYLGRFESTQSRLKGAEASIEITCNGSDFFKQSCEKARADKSAAEADLTKYRSTIQAIIARGK